MKIVAPARPLDLPRLLTAAVEAAANGILITDRAGTVLWVNPAFTAITGWSAAEILGETPRVLRSGTQPAAFYREMWDTILAGRVWHGELWNRHRDGHLYAEEQTITPVTGASGEITHFIGIKQDVTRRKEWERMLERRSAELAVMSRTVSAITASLKADAVLTAIVGAIRELLPRASGATVQAMDVAGRIVTRAASPDLDPTHRRRFAPGQGVAGIAWRDRAVVNVADVTRDPRFIAGEEPPPYRALLAVPIVSGEQVLGVLSVESAEPGAFGDHEEQLLELFAGSAAIAVAHATEYDARLQAESELRRYSEQLEGMVAQRTAALVAAQAQLLEQSRLEREILLAGEVQASLLPHRMPDVPGFEFAGLALAARYVSGDLYDWSGVTPDRCCLVIADIAGKGVPAAMLTSTARALMRDAADRGAPPGRALADLNRMLYEDLTRAGMFITVATACLDRPRAALDYASAGHTEGLLLRAASGRCDRLGATAPPVGVLRDVEVPERRVFLRPGDVLLLYSDGVTEAEREGGELFGVERLIALLRERAAGPAGEIAQGIVHAVDVFAGARRGDDLTLLVVKALPRTVELRLPADLPHVEDALAAVRDLAGPYGGEFAYELELAASELLTNVVRHAYAGGPGTLQVRARLEPDRVELELEDEGRPFDLGKLPAQLPREPCVGGYGVHIVRKLVDALDYAPGTGAPNRWRLVKCFREAPDGR